MITIAWWAGGLLFVSFAVAVWSLRDYKGERAVGRIRSRHRREQIKGSILFHKGKPKHYSSYSR